MCSEVTLSKIMCGWRVECGAELLLMASPCVFFFLFFLFCVFFVFILDWGWGWRVKKVKSLGNKGYFSLVSCNQGSKVGSPRGATWRRSVERVWGLVGSCCQTWVSATHRWRTEFLEHNLAVFFRRGLLWRLMDWNQQILANVESLSIKE